MTITRTGCAALIALALMAGAARAQTAPADPERLYLAGEVASLDCDSPRSRQTVAEREASAKGAEALAGLVYAFSATDFKIDVKQFERSLMVGSEKASDATRSAVAAILAQSLSAEDLRATLAFYRSADGHAALCAVKADNARRLAESQKDEPETLPPYVESPAERAFLETAAGRAFQAARASFEDPDKSPTADHMSIFIDQTSADYCRRRRCGELQTEFFLRLRMMLAPGRADGQHAVNGKTAEDLFPDSRVAALARAACDGKADAVVAAVKEGVDPNAGGEEWVDGTGSSRVWTPLFWAIECDSPAGVEALLASGADPNHVGKYSLTPVTIAAGGSHPGILPLLLKHGGDPNAQDDSDTALQIALQTGIFLEVDGKPEETAFANWRALLEAGADPHRKAGFDQDAAERAAMHERFDKVYEILLRGYHGDLRELGRWVTYSHEQEADLERTEPDPWRDRVEKLLTERGVTFPVLREPLPPLTDEDP